MMPGELAATQVRIVHWFDDVPIPIIGFVDFAFMDDRDVDLKTTAHPVGTRKGPRGGVARGARCVTRTTPGPFYYFKLDGVFPGEFPPCFICGRSDSRGGGALSSGTQVLLKTSLLTL